MTGFQWLDPTWNPLVQQFSEPDTTYLLDPDADTAAGYTAGFGGLVPQRGDNTSPAVVAGKFRKGIQSSHSSSTLMVPLDGLVGAKEFTIEFWAQCLSGDWSAAAFGSWIVVGGNPSGTADQITIGIGGSQVRVAFTHQQNPASVSGYSGTLNATVTNGTYPQNAWVSVALTLKSGTLILYLNGTQVGTLNNVISPALWSGDAYKRGLMTGLQNWIISDVRVSQLARTPSKRSVNASVNARAVVAVSASASGATIQSLTGNLHAPNSNTTEQTAIAAAQAAFQGMRVVRTDKMLTCTPIKAGAIDGTHPSLGHSGSYSYDWQVVDRSVNYIKNNLNAELLLGFSACPQLLGGSAPPYSGAQLTSDYCWNSGFNNSVPNDLTAFATMCADLVYHIVNDLAVAIPYGGVWNEPDGSFWAGTQGQYQSLFQSIVAAVKAVYPTIKIGGPSIANFNSSSWISGLMTFCQANSITLDFVDCHMYNGDASEPAQLAAFVAAEAAALGVSAPALVCGEWSWQIANVGFWPWQQPPGAGIPTGWASTGTVDYQRNDWQAGFIASMLIQFQQQGFARSIYNDPVNDHWDSLFDASTGGILAPYNAMRLWSMTQGNTVLQTTVTGDPGVQAVASKDGGGKVYVYLSALRYRKDRACPVLVPVAGKVDGTTVTAYVVDDQHSNSYDAGAGNAALQTVPVPAISGGNAALTLRGRSAALLVVN